jgi:MoxR-like ATPase
MNLGELQSLAQRIRAEIAIAVHGQDEVIELLLVGMFARGHCLIEGPPGTAKTLLAQSLAASLQLKFGRIQFTPDLMPGDVLGANIFDFRESAFHLVRGPIFTEILLADEINRAPPKTQSALLQAMQERVATIDGVDHVLGENFFVVATQNPIEQQGTYPLPEAQLDRFLFKIAVRFPAEAAELEILRRHSALPLDHAAHSSGVMAVAAREELSAARTLIDGVRLDDSILAYALALSRATRVDSEILQGASTRAADSLCAGVRALAALEGRDYAIPDDVKRLYPHVMRHRVVLAATAEIEGRTADDVLANIVNQVEAPK